MLNPFICSDSLRKCSECKKMYYCNKKCQTIDWKKHKYECSIYKQSYSEIDFELYRFLLRLYLFIQNNPTLKEKKDTLSNDQRFGRSFNDLMTHKENIKSDIKRLLFFNMLVQRFNKCGIDFDKEVLFECFCKYVINSLTILDIEFDPIGWGLYIAESMFDHSCGPNATTVYNGINIEVRAFKPITDEDKITIHYYDMKKPKYIRQEYLLNGYYFNCNCQRCCNESLSDCKSKIKNNKSNLF